MQILIEKVKDSLLSHDVLETLEPLAGQKCANHLDEHRQCLELDSARLESALVHRCEEGSQELESTSLNEARDELLGRFRLTLFLLSCCFRHLSRCLTLFLLPHHQVVQ